MLFKFDSSFSKCIGHFLSAFYNREKKIPLIFSDLFILHRGVISVFLFWICWLIFQEQILLNKNSNICCICFWSRAGLYKSVPDLHFFLFHSLQLSWFLQNSLQMNFPIFQNLLFIPGLQSSKRSFRELHDLCSFVSG